MTTSKTGSTGTKTPKLQPATQKPGWGKGWFYFVKKNNGALVYPSTHERRLLRVKIASILAGLSSAALAFTLVACYQGQSNASTSSAPSSSPNLSTHEVRTAAGVACSVEGDVGPPSYSVRDIGKSDVPKVSAANVTMGRAIMRYVHPATLRFAYVPHFIVFDARNGMCSDTPYDVLNMVACNTVYQTTNVKHGEFAAPGGCFDHPRPWIPHDGGNPQAPSWDQYDNAH